MNNIEFETKVLSINVEEISKKLLSIGAKQISDTLSKRMIFDIKSDGIEWVRVREEGVKKTLTYKYKPLNNSKIGVTQEIEVEVSDFDKTVELITKLPFYYRTMYQENRSIIFRKGNIEFKIAIWPLIDPYLEIEGSNEVEVLRALEELDLKGKDVGDFDIAKIYAEKGIDMNSYPELKF